MWINHDGKTIRKGFRDKNGINRAYAWLSVATEQERATAGVTWRDPEPPAQVISETLHRPKESVQYQQTIKNKEKYYGIIS